MSFSMTGFGQSARHFGGYYVQFEIKSVNHRYAEIVLRMPREWTCYEDDLKRIVQRHVKRGRIDVNISKEKAEDSAKSFVVNTSAARAYLDAARQLGESLGIDDSLTAHQLLSMPDVLISEDTLPGSAHPDEEWEEVLKSGLEEALAGLVKMREKEGRHLSKDLEERLSKLEELHAELTRLAPTVVGDYRNRLRQRLSELLDGTMDEQRFGMEVAIFADRSNVDEELTRLGSHFEQCRELLRAHEPVGRKLDFLIQEMNREVNTIGSKANHLALVNRVVEMKAELEKIREQAANME
ncbi:YicC/YloC family endoribonuclease [Paenibacillus tuaregi]|uniref:YicC/YloC family endoribonuclease n=1 Tax=Paenibacillus tuaregi TaxID=1816681 RepID=UPI000838F9E5|nr:YicC/YloC family endoribonuclease [Paenibacillus tuaregi]